MSDESGGLSPYGESAEVPVPVWHDKFLAFLDSEEVAAGIESLATQTVVRHAQRGSLVDPDQARLVAALCLAWSTAWNAGRAALLDEMGLAGLDEK